MTFNEMNGWRTIGGSSSQRLVRRSFYVLFRRINVRGGIRRRQHSEGWQRRRTTSYHMTLAKDKQTTRKTTWYFLAYSRRTALHMAVVAGGVRAVAWFQYGDVKPP